MYDSYHGIHRYNSVLNDIDTHTHTHTQTQTQTHAIHTSQMLSKIYVL